MSLFETPISEILFTALVSGGSLAYLGAVVARYIDRARLRISVDSIAFSAKSVEIPDRLITAAREDQWGPELEKFVDYEVLSKRERFSSELILELKEMKRECDEWLNRFRLERPGQTIAVHDIFANPYFHGNLAGSIVFGALRTRDFPALPQKIGDVQTEDFKLEIQERDDEWVIHLGSAGIRFRLQSKQFTEREVETTKQICKSFAIGHLENIRAIISFCSSKAAVNISSLTDLRDEIRSVLETQSFLRVSLSVTNLGRIPAILNGYMALRIVAGNGSEIVVCRILDEPPVDQGANFVADIRDLSEIPNILKGVRGVAPSNESGHRFLVEPYLSSAKGSVYRMIPPNDSVALEIESSKPIGKFSDIARVLFHNFETGAIQCQVSCRTEGGTVYKSGLSDFGKKLTTETEAAILRMAK
jgi:hypothetical protein